MRLCNQPRYQYSHPEFHSNHLLQTCFFTAKHTEARQHLLLNSKFHPHERYDSSNGVYSINGISLEPWISMLLPLIAACSSSFQKGISITKVNLHPRTPYTFCSQSSLPSCIRARLALGGSHSPFECRLRPFSRRTFSGTFSLAVTVNDIFGLKVRNDGTALGHSPAIDTCVCLSRSLRVNA